MMKFFTPFCLFSLILVFFSCDIQENNDVDPTHSFVRIYDSGQFDRSFDPVDLLQTSDGGYLVLGGYRREDSDFLGVYLMKADSAGNYASDTFYPQEQVNPVGEIMDLGNRYFFISMDAVGLGVYLNEVDNAGELLQSTSLGLTYPLYAKKESDDLFILLSYDSNNKTTVLSAINSGGTILKQQEFDIGAGEDVEEPIIEHFTRTGRQLPFFAGRTGGGLYYFNGFYNYTLSLIFTDLNSEDPNGIIQGQQEKGGISGLMNLTGNMFAVSRFNFGDNYVNALTELATNEITSSVDIEGNPMIEWVNDAGVSILGTDINNTAYVIYASTTKGQQMVLQFYERGTGNFITSEYLGFSNPYQFAAIEATSDQGLIVLGRTQVAGRFQRLCLFKLSEKDLKELVR